MMVKTKTYKGIDYVQFGELPAEQRVVLETTFNKSLFIKILINETILTDCIQFRDYATWFTEVYNPLRTSNAVSKPPAAVLQKI